MHKDIFWATVCKTVCPMPSSCHCPVCLTFLHCGRTVGWIKKIQDETWHAGRPRPWPHCVRWGPSSSFPKGHSSPIFGPYLLRPNGCMDQDAIWYGARPWPRRLCVRWGPRSPLQKGAEPPKFSAHVYCAKGLDGSRWYLARR